MDILSLTSAAGSLSLHGYHWTCETPKAVMVLIHGFGEHAGRYDTMAQYLCTHNIAVVAIDLRGHGQSPGPRGVVCHYDHLHADIDAVIDDAGQRYPDIPLILYGHSMGGGLVLNYTLQNRRNIGAVIASAPLLALPQPIPQGVQILARGLSKLFPKLAISQPIQGEKISRLPDEQALYMNDPLNHGRLGLRLADGMIAGGAWVLSQARQWDTPLLLMHARDDQLTDFSASAAFAANAQNCRFIPIDNTEHEIHNDTSRAHVYAAMTTFITEQI